MYTTRPALPCPAVSGGSQGRQASSFSFRATRRVHRLTRLTLSSAPSLIPASIEPRGERQGWPTESRSGVCSAPRTGTSRHPTSTASSHPRPLTPFRTPPPHGAGQGQIRHPGTRSSTRQTHSPKPTTCPARTATRPSHPRPPLSGHGEPPIECMRPRRAKRSSTACHPAPPDPHTPRLQPRT